METNQALAEAAVAADGRQLSEWCVSIRSTGVDPATKDSLGNKRGIWRLPTSPDRVVPIAVEGVGFKGTSGDNSASLTLTALRYVPRSRSAWTWNPVEVVVTPISSTITSWLVSGRPHQFMLM